MNAKGLLCFVALFTFAASPFACTGGDSGGPPPQADAATLSPADSSLDVVQVEGSSPADVQAPDAKDAALAPDSPPLIDAADASAQADASDATTEDAGDATTQDAGDATTPDAGDAATEDASDATPQDASDATAQDAADASVLDAGACALNPLATTWDVTADFSTTNDPCGVWTYGYTQSLGSTPLTVYSTLQGGSDWVDPTNVTSGAPTVGKNFSGGTINGVLSGQAFAHPGPHGEYATSRWTAPRAGTYSLAVQFFAGDTGTTDGAVLHGTTVLFESNTNASPTYATTLTMAAGDTVDVAVGITGGETYNYGSTPVTAIVTEKLPDAGADAACTSGALSFDGVDDFVDIPGTGTLHLNTAMTVEAWIKTSTPVATENLFLSKHTCNVVAGWFLGINTYHAPSGANVADYYVSTDPQRDYGATALDDGAWHHVAGTWDGTTATLYVDGVPVASQARSYASTTLATIEIGAATGGTCGHFTGLMDEVSVWSVARTAQQIALDHATPITAGDPGLEGYWNFNQSGCGLTAADGSGHGRDGVLGGSTSDGGTGPTWVSDGPF